MMWQKKANPFHKFLTKEDHFQIRTCILLATQYPKLAWWHTPNEGKRSPFERYKLGLMGTMSGVSDLIIICPHSEHKGLCLELKVPPNKPTENQLNYLARMQACGWDIAIAYSDNDIYENFQTYIEKKYRYFEHFKQRSKLRL